MNISGMEQYIDNCSSEQCCRPQSLPHNDGDLIW